MQVERSRRNNKMLELKKICDYCGEKIYFPYLETNQSLYLCELCFDIDNLEYTHIQGVLKIKAKGKYWHRLVEE